MLQLFMKSVVKGCKIVLPSDFICSEKKPLEEFAGKVGPRKLEKEPAEGENKAALADQTISKKSLETGKNEVSDGRKEEVVEASDKKPSARTFDPSFKPQHWADASIFYGLSDTIDLESQIQKKFEAVAAKALKTHQIQSAENSATNLNAGDPSAKELQSATTQQQASA